MANLSEHGRMKFLQYGTGCVGECSEVTVSTVPYLLNSSKKATGTGLNMDKTEKPNLQVTSSIPGAETCFLISNQNFKHSVHLTVTCPGRGHQNITSCWIIVGHVDT